MAPITWRGSVMAAALALAAAVGAPDARDPTRVGVYWWDAWWEGSPYIREPLTTAFAEREPLYGWRSDSPEAMDQALGLMASHGIDFIVFLWYERGAWRFDDSHPSDLMDTGLDLYLRTPNRHAVGFCLMWTQPVPADRLDAAVAEWLGCAADPDYTRIDGRPALFVYADVLDSTPGGDEALRDQITRVRAAAAKADLPGLYIVANHFSIGQADRFRALGFDAVSSYVNFGGQPGANPYSALVDSVRATWDSAPAGLPYIPNVTTGWDPRPRMGFMDTYDRWFEGRTPDALREYVAAALDWVATHPDRVPSSPLVTLYAWNELDEGGWLVPTRGEGPAMLEAVRDAVQACRWGTSAERRR
ncbi:MAG TPA: glycoside hydrolase family 99-like domain-containing protein [Armatimonadota bacterium]|nr:glycoside hydrolase family 99-like domain-containing protein [Armatimonadota bacterium]